MTEEEDFLKAVLANPLDDFPRLVLADKFEEDGEVERAEFIRYQIDLAKDPKRELCQCAACQDPSGRQCVCLVRQRERELWTDYAMCGRLEGEKLVGPSSWFNAWDLNAARTDGNGCYAAIRRGFVDEVRVPTLATWLGGECGRCGGWESITVFAGPGATNPKHITCPACSGTGRILGIGREVLLRHPVTKVVVGNIDQLTHYIDHEVRADDGRPAVQRVWYLTSDVWGLGEGLDRDFFTKEEAAKALSAALIKMS